MKKNMLLPWIVVLLIFVVGSFVNFYVSNLLFSDLSNSFYGFIDYGFISSIPFFCLGVQIVLLIICLYRIIKKPSLKKATLKVYLTIIWALSVVGIIFSLVSGINIYGSFIKPYPFPYATLVILVTEIVVLGGSLFGYLYADKLGEDSEKKKQTLKNGLYTVCLFLMIFLAQNRLGALIWSPTFVSVRTLYMTWPFYVGLLIPCLQLVHTALYTSEKFKLNPKSGIVFAWVLFGLVISTNLATFIIGYFNTTFISVISPMLALERLASMPVDVILILIVCLLYSITSLKYSYRMQKKAVSKQK